MTLSLPTRTLRSAASARQAFAGVYYGWWIVLASMIALLVASAFYWQGFGIFFLALQEEFSTSRAALSGAIALSQLEGGMLGPLGGYLVDRFGPRRMMIIGSTIMGGGFILMSQIHSLVEFYIVFLCVISVGMSIGIRVPALVAPANWFVRRRGLAIGLAISGGGLGGIFIPLLAWLVASFGWRTAAVIAGIAVWSVAIPLAMVMRGRPEEYGLRPDGNYRRPEEAAEGAGEQAGRAGEPAAAEESEFTLAQALRLPVFWLLAGAFGLRQFAVGAMSLHLVPFLVDGGRSLQIASLILAGVALTSIAGRIGFGVMADRFAPRLVMATSMAMVGSGALLLLLSRELPLLLAAFVVIYAIGWGGGATTMSAVRGSYFGRRAFGTISGSMDFVQMFGLVLGPVYAGFIFDLTGSYVIAFSSFAVSALLAAVLMAFLRPPRQRIDDPEALRGFAAA